MVHENRHLINCLRGDGNEHIIILIDSGWVNDDYDDTLLMRAVFWNNDDDVFDYLIEKSQDFSVVNRHGWNIIHYIVLYGDDKISESELIKLSHKTNVESLINERGVGGETPLHYAAHKNKYRTIARLISMGSDVNLRNIYNKLPDEHDDCDDETKRIIRQSR